MDPPTNGGLSASVPPQQVALTVARLLDHLHELDSCDLPMPTGHSEPIVTVAEVRAWLGGLRIRASAGERL